MEELLSTLVGMPTISEDFEANERALDYIERYLGKRGMYTKRYVLEGHGALVATVKPDTKRAKILLYGHVDVMPATEQGFVLRREGDKLFGRGTYDMKFALAGYMQFVDQVKDRLSDYDFYIMVTTDEEYGGRDGINSIPHLMDMGYRADICIMPDGGRPWDIEAMAKGYWRFDLVATGRSAHGSRPWEGDSASFKLVQALQDLGVAFEHHGPETDTLNIGQIHGNGTYNQIPSSMSAAIEIRLATDESAAVNQQLIADLCKKYSLHIVTRILAPPLRQDVTHPLMQGFMQSITRVTGHKSKPCLSLAASDAVYFNEVGVPCALTYLPGGGHHGENEWISRDALLQFPEVIYDYLTAHASLDR